MPSSKRPGSISGLGRQLPPSSPTMDQTAGGCHHHHHHHHHHHQAEKNKEDDTEQSDGTPEGSERCAEGAGNSQQAASTVRCNLAACGTSVTFAKGKRRRKRRRRLEKRREEKRRERQKGRKARAGKRGKGREEWRRERGERCDQVERKRRETRELVFQNLDGLLGMAATFAWVSCARLVAPSAIGCDPPPPCFGQAVALIHSSMHVSRFSSLPLPLALHERRTAILEPAHQIEHTIPWSSCRGDAAIAQHRTILRSSAKKSKQPANRRTNTCTERMPRS